MLNDLKRWVCNKCAADICLTCTEDNEHVCPNTCLRCPVCVVPIYKDKGCNHITCQRKAELMYNKISLSGRWVIGANNIGPK